MESYAEISMHHAPFSKESGVFFYTIKKQRMKNVYQPQDLQKIQAAIAIADAGTMMDADPQLLYGQMHVHPAWIKIQNTRLAENFLYKAAEKLSIQQDTMNFGNLSDAILQKINSELMSQIMLP